MHRTRSKVTIGNASDTVWFRHIITTCTFSNMTVKTRFIYELQRNAHKSSINISDLETSVFI